jgi:uncharacterized protein (TIGR02996 family)
MADDAGFVLAMAGAPDDAAVSLRYADWLQTHGDSRAELLRLWCELLAVSYSEETFRRIQTLADSYREQVDRADPKWLAKVGRARLWVDRELAVKLVRVYLRINHGRKEDRQHIGFESWQYGDEWKLYYWRQPPTHKQTSWHGKSWLLVNKLSGAIRGEHHWRSPTITG